MHSVGLAHPLNAKFLFLQIQERKQKLKNLNGLVLRSTKHAFDDPQLAVFIVHINVTSTYAPGIHSSWSA